MNVFSDSLFDAVTNPALFYLPAPSPPNALLSPDHLAPFQLNHNFPVPFRLFSALLTSSSLHPASFYSLLAFLSIQK